MVSVLITVRGSDRFLDGAIRTVCEQSHRPLEVVLVDDGIDWCETSLSRIGAKCARASVSFRTISATQPGRASALNSGLAVTEGSCIAILDVDDRWYPDKLELQVAQLQRQGGLVGTLARQVVTSSGVVFEPIPGAGLDVADVTEEISRHCPLVHSSLLVSKRTLEVLGGYDEQRATQLDWDLMFRAVLQGERLYRVEKMLTEKRLHDRQSFEASNKLRYLKNSIGLQLDIQRQMGLPLWQRYFVLRRALIWLLPRKLKWRIMRLLARKR